MGCFRHLPFAPFPATRSHPAPLSPPAPSTSLPCSHRARIVPEQIAIYLWQGGNPLDLDHGASLLIKKALDLS